MAVYEFEWEKVSTGTVRLEAEDEDAARRLAKEELDRFPDDWCEDVELNVWRPSTSTPSTTREVGEEEA